MGKAIFILPFIALFSLGFCEESSAAQSNETVKNQISVQYQKMQQAMMDGDAKIVANLYTQDAVLFGTKGVVRGRAELEASFSGWIKAGIVLDCEPEEVEAFGNVAYETGRAAVMKRDGTVLAINKYMVFWKNDAGVWKMHRDIVQANEPAASDQSMPDIYASALHDLKRVRSMAEFPRFTFIENLIELPDGRIVVTAEYMPHGNLPEKSTQTGRLYLIDDAGVSELAAVQNSFLLGLERLDGDLIVTAMLYDDGAEGDGSIQSLMRGEGALFRVSLAGQVEELARFPGVAMANGIARAEDGRFLIAASDRGQILYYDSKSGETGVWLKDGALAPGEAFPIGVNGLRVVGGQVYFSNSSQMILGKVDYKSKKVEIVHKNAMVDDFAVAGNGTIYGATHSFNTVVAFAPDGTRTIIADVGQGATGSTSVRLGTAGNLLVSTAGNANYRVLGMSESAVVPSHVLHVSLRKKK